MSLREQCEESELFLDLHEIFDRVVVYPQDRRFGEQTKQVFEARQFAAQCHCGCEVQLQHRRHYSFRRRVAGQESAQQMNKMSIFWNLFTLACDPFLCDLYSQFVNWNIVQLDQLFHNCLSFSTLHYNQLNEFLDRVVGPCLD